MRQLIAAVVVMLGACGDLLGLTTTDPPATSGDPDASSIDAFATAADAGDSVDAFVTAVDAGGSVDAAPPSFTCLEVLPQNVGGVTLTGIPDVTQADQPFAVIAKRGQYLTFVQLEVCSPSGDTLDPIRPTTAPSSLSPSPVWTFLGVKLPAGWWRVAFVGDPTTATRTIWGSRDVHVLP